MSIIGQQIKKYRIENGFTQEQVGKNRRYDAGGIKMGKRKYAGRRNIALDCRRSQRQC